MLCLINKNKCAKHRPSTNDGVDADYVADDNENIVRAASVKMVCATMAKIRVFHRNSANNMYFDAKEDRITVARTVHCNLTRKSRCASSLTLLFRFGGGNEIQSSHWFAEEGAVAGWRECWRRYSAGRTHLRCRDKHTAKNRINEYFNDSKTHTHAHKRTQR